MLDLATLISILEHVVKDRAQLALENAALRHQLAILKRSVTRPKIEDSDRIVWIMLRRLLKDWKDALVFVKPDTVVRWHRRGFRYYWKRADRCSKLARRDSHSPHSVQERPAFYSTIGISS